MANETNCDPPPTCGRGNICGMHMSKEGSVQPTLIYSMLQVCTGVLRDWTYILLFCHFDTLIAVRLHLCFDPRIGYWDPGSTVHHAYSDLSFLIIRSLDCAPLIKFILDWGGLDDTCINLVWIQLVCILEQILE